MSNLGSPRQVRRRLGRRMAAVSLVATGSLVGTYLGALRPQPTYAAPGGSQVGTRNGLAPPAAPLSGCEQVTGTKTYVDDDTSLQAAITSSVDDSIICITGTSGFRLSQTMVIDDTSITLVGDDSSITLLPAQNGDDTSLRHIYADFQAVGDDTLVIHSLTLAGDDTVFGFGASIYMYGRLTDGDSIRIYDSVFMGNVAADDGGALGLDDVDAYVFDSTFSGNVSGRDGGAIYTDGDLYIYDSKFEGNSASVEGGAIYNENFDLTVYRSTFRENTAMYGGAIYHRDDDLDIVDSSFVSNRAERDSAGYGGFGGAVYTRSTAYLYVNNSRFADNQATAKGGALYLQEDEWRIYDSTFDSNRVLSSDDTALGGAIMAFDGDLTVERSFFTDNSAVKGGGIAVLSDDTSVYDTTAVTSSAFVGNDARYIGAGIYVNAKSVDTVGVSGSSFIENGDDTAPLAGGGLLIGNLVDPSTPTDLAYVWNSTFMHNQAIYTGAGIWWNVDLGGSNPFVHMSYLTVSHNTVSNPGGDVTSGAGIYVSPYDDSAILLNSVLFNNTVGDDTLSDFGVDRRSPANTYLVNSSITSQESIYVRDGANVVAANPLLGSLQDNGGVRIGFEGAHYLPTARPAWNSPVAAVEAYPGSQLPAPLDVDQLGAQRGTPAVWGAVLASNRPPAPTPSIPPSAPLSVSATPSDASATVMWSPPSSSGSFPVSTYQAVVSPGGATCLVASAPCTITGLSNGVEYTVAVRALNGAGWGAFSSPSTPFIPQAPPVEKSIVITGTRGEVRGESGVIVDGETTGLVGAQVAPWVKFPGQTSYAEGAARPTVDAQGDFTWQRRTGKKIYVYFRTTEGDVRSNRIIIRAR